MISYDASIGFAQGDTMHSTKSSSRFAGNAWILVLAVFAAVCPVMAGETAKAAANTEEESYKLDDEFYDKYNCYVTLFNVVNGDLDKAVDHYFDSIGEDEYLPEKEDFRYQKYIFSGATGPAIDAAAGFPEKKPKLLIDASVSALQPAAKKVWDLLREADAYYAGVKYADDNFARGKELHAAIDAATDELWPLFADFEEHIDRMGEEVSVRELKDMEAEGYFITAAMLKLVKTGQAAMLWLNEQDIGDDNIHGLDIEAFQSQYDSLRQAVENLETAAKEHSPLQEGLRQATVESFVKTATDLKACAANMIALAKKGEQKKNPMKAARMPKNELPTDFANQLNKLIDMYNAK